MSIASEIKTRILFRNASQSKLGRITEAGLIHNSVGVPDNPMRILGCFAIVYILDGGGRYKDASGYQSIIKPGVLITLFPKVAHSYGPMEGEPWSEIWFTFEGPIFDLWEKVGILNAAQPIHHVEPIDYWFRRLEDCLGAPRQPNKFTYPLIEICRLQLVLSEMLLDINKSSNPPQELAWAS